MGLARTRGAAGEALAAAYLELVGCEVMARNVRLNGVEIDLVVRDGAVRVLVEVKWRNRSDYGGAALALDHSQRRRLVKAAHALLAEHDGPIRIDLVAIELAAEGAAVRHYRNAVTS